MPSSGSKDTVEIIIPAGKGGGLDLITRFMVRLNETDRYGNFQLKAVNKPGGFGGTAMQYLFSQEGNGNVVISTSNIFITTPLLQNELLLDLPFTYRDFTPIGLLGDDNFVLWVHKDSDWKTAGEFIQTASEKRIVVGGTGRQQEDEIVFRAIRMNTMAKPFKYMPYRGGGDVVKALVGKHLEATVNQVSEAGPFYPDFLRPLCVFQDNRLDTPGYEDVPTCKEAGIPVSYHMLRGLIFAPPGISIERKTELVNLFKHISENEDWKEFNRKTSVDARFISGDELLELFRNFEVLNRAIFLHQRWIRE